jgi:prepilin-type N-terminal cleavage/methylation domain-containing protein
MKSAGFTLIEMSIVLVIVGLIIGGIILGADLIHSAKIRAQVSELYKYDIAVRTFRLKYNAVPGDISQSKAQSFGLPYMGGVGNDNGTLEDSFYCMPPAAIAGEMFMLFEHLSLTNLINSSNRDYVNYPGTLLLGGVFPMTKIGSGAIVPFSKANKQLAYFLGINHELGSGNAWANLSTAGIMTPMEAYEIDVKIDDGLPTSGKVRSAAFLWLYTCVAVGGGYSSAETDVSNSACSTAITNIYNFGTTSNACRVIVDSQ